MKKYTMHTVKKIIKHFKITALSDGRYDPPFTVEKYDNRGKVPFRSFAYVDKVIWVNALEDLIRSVQKENRNT